MLSRASRVAVRTARAAPRRLAHSEPAAAAAPGAKKVLGFITPHPSYSGGEAVLRGVFPHNWQVVLVVLGLYTVIGVAASGGDAPADAPTKPDLKTETVVSAIPTMADQPEEWAAFMAEEENVKKYFDSLNESV